MSSAEQHPQRRVLDWRSEPSKMRGVVAALVSVAFHAGCSAAFVGGPPVPLAGANGAHLCSSPRHQSGARPPRSGATALRAGEQTEAKFRGPGNPNARSLQTANAADDLIDDVLNKRFGAGEAFYGVRQSAQQKDYDAIAEEAKQIMAMRDVREDATLVIGACRTLGSVAQWTTIKAMQRDIPIRILASDFDAAEKTFGTDGANLDIYFGDASDMDQLDNACDGARAVVYADEGSLPFGANSFEARSKSGLVRLLEVEHRCLAIVPELAHTRDP